MAQTLRYRRGQLMLALALAGGLAALGNALIALTGVGAAGAGAAA